MLVIEFFRRRVLLAAALAGLVVGAAVGLAQPIRASAPDVAELDQWVPYGKMRLARFDEAEFSKVRAARIWGDAPGAAGSGAVQWRLTGIITHPAPAILVVAQGSKTVQQIKVAGALPDGGKIVGITSRSVRFTRSGCTYERALYSAIDPAEGGDCNPGAAGAQRQVPEQ